MSRLLNNLAGAHAAYEEFDFKFRRAQAPHSPKLTPSAPVRPIWHPEVVFELVGEAWLGLKTKAIRMIDKEYEP